MALGLLIYVSNRIEIQLFFFASLSVRDYMNEKKDYISRQIGNPDGNDIPNKKYYDPRVWLRKGEEAFKIRLNQAFFTNWRIAYSFFTKFINKTFSNFKYASIFGNVLSH